MPIHARAVRVVLVAAACALLLPADLMAGTTACEHGRVASVSVRSQGIFDLTELSGEDRFGWAYRLVDRLHVPTAERVIRREILLREGDCFEPGLLEESERLLRAAHFVAGAEIIATRDAAGDRHLIVDVRDDWSTRASLLTRNEDGLRLTGLLLQEDNLVGTGQQLGVFYREEYREPRYGVRYGHPQLFGSRLQAGLEIARAPTGLSVRQSLAWPFVGDRGRWAFRQRVSVDDRFFSYVALGGGEPVEVLLPEDRRGFDFGGVYRFRQRQRTAFLGGALAGEWISYPESARLFRPRGEPPPPGSVPLDDVEARMDSVSSVRALLLAGHRDVYFVPRLAVNSVRGVDDVRLGTEVEMAFGRSLQTLSTSDDLSLSLGVSSAGEFLGSLLVGGEMLLEGRRDYTAAENASEWRDLFGELGLWTYYRPTPTSAQTFVGTVSAAGGWQTTLPFQLTLGHPTGLRGHDRHVAAGARRAVASLEHRAYLRWPYPELFDLGSVLFVDIGQSWPGDVPFAFRNGGRVGVGAGLRAAFPPGSRTTYRLDVGVPAQGGLSLSDVQVRVGVGQAIGATGPREDAQLRRSSRRGLGTSLFSYPD